MNNLSYYESIQRGIPGFPIELYDVNSKHPRYEMLLHWHKDYEIIKVNRGSFNLVLEDKEYTLKSGDCVFMPSGVVHGGKPDRCKYQCLVFSPSILHSSQRCEHIMRTHINSPVIFTADELIDTIFNGIKEINGNYEFMVLGALYNLIGKIQNSAFEHTVSPNPRIEKIKTAISYIDKNYASSISLSDISAVCNMTPNYFCRFFKELTGETPIEYLTKHRIETSCEMLSFGMSVTDTAYACGFNDTSYFINIFRKRLGISPKQYQLQKTKKSVAS